jgi:HlyD family secretion protein
MLLLAACSPAAPQVITDANGLPNQFEQLPTPLPTREVTPRTSVVADGVLALAGPPIGLNFEVSNAKVTAINTRVGQTVKAGDPLGSVDDTTLRDAVTDAQMNMDLVEAQIRLQAAPIGKEELASAQAALNSAYANYQTTKAGATESEVEQARVSWEQAKNQYLSAQTQRDLVCGQDQDGPNCKSQEAAYGSAYESMQAAYARYQEVLQPASKDKVTQAYSSVASAQANLDSKKGGATDEQKRVAQAQYDQAKAALDRAKTNLDKAKLVSPCACVVQEANLVVGGVPTSTAFLLVNLNGIQFKTTNLSERDVANIAPGSAANIRLKAYDRSLSGKVSAVLAQSTGAQSGAALFTVLIDVDALGAAGKLLLPGMTGQAEIEIR